MFTFIAATHMNDGLKGSSNKKLYIPSYTPTVLSIYEIYKT